MLDGVWNLPFLRLSPESNPQDPCVGQDGEGDLVLEGTPRGLRARKRGTSTGILGLGAQGRPAGCRAVRREGWWVGAVAGAPPVYIAHSSSPSPWSVSVGVGQDQCWEGCHPTVRASWAPGLRPSPWTCSRGHFTSEPGFSLQSGLARAVGVLGAHVRRRGSGRP